MGKRTRRGRVPSTPVTSTTLREMSQSYLQDLAARLLTVADVMDTAQPPIPQIGVTPFGMATKGLDALVQLTISAEAAAARSCTPRTTERLRAATAGLEPREK